MRSLDLDARLAIARAESGTDDELPSIQWRGRTWELPADLPIDFLTFLDVPSRLPLALETLLGPGIRSLDPPMGMREALAVAESIPELYGLTLGESEASPASSANGGTRSRPTSSGTTASRSGKR